MDTITKSTVLPELKVAHAGKCRNSSGVSIMTNFTIDFTGCTIGELLGYATSDRTIAGQRAWEKYSPAELKEKVEGATIHAKVIGQKIKSDAEVKAEFKARFQSASPELQKEMIEELQSQMIEG